MSGGVPAGARKKKVTSMCMAGTPASRTDGTSGSFAMRSSEVTANARILPDCASGSAEVAVVNHTWMRPLSKSTCASEVVL